MFRKQNQRGFSEIAAQSPEGSDVDRDEMSSVTSTSGCSQAGRCATVFERLDEFLEANWLSG